MMYIIEHYPTGIILSKGKYQPWKNGQSIIRTLELMGEGEEKDEAVGENLNFLVFILNVLVKM